MNDSPPAIPDTEPLIPVAAIQFLIVIPLLLIFISCAASLSYYVFFKPALAPLHVYLRAKKDIAPYPNPQEEAVINAALSESRLPTVSNHSATINHSLDVEDNAVANESMITVSVPTSDSLYRRQPSTALPAYSLAPQIDDLRESPISLLSTIDYLRLIEIPFRIFSVHAGGIWFFGHCSLIVQIQSYEKVFSLSYAYTGTLVFSLLANIISSAVITHHSVRNNAHRSISLAHLLPTTGFEKRVERAIEVLDPLSRFCSSLFLVDTPVWSSCFSPRHAGLLFLRAIICLTPPMVINSLILPNLKAPELWIVPMLLCFAIDTASLATVAVTSIAALLWFKSITHHTPLHVRETAKAAEEDFDFGEPPEGTTEVLQFGSKDHDETSSISSSQTSASSSYSYSNTPRRVASPGVEWKPDPSMFTDRLMESNLPIPTFLKYVPTAAGAASSDLIAANMKVLSTRVPKEASSSSFDSSEESIAVQADILSQQNSVLARAFAQAQLTAFADVVSQSVAKPLPVLVTNPSTSNGAVGPSIYQSSHSTGLQGPSSRPEGAPTSSSAATWLSEHGQTNSAGRKPTSLITTTLNTTFSSLQTGLTSGMSQFQSSISQLPQLPVVLADAVLKVVPPLPPLTRNRGIAPMPSVEGPAVESEESSTVSASVQEAHALPVATTPASAEVTLSPPPSTISVPFQSQIVAQNTWMPYLTVSSSSHTSHPLHESEIPHIGGTSSNFASRTVNQLRASSALNSAAARTDTSCTADPACPEDDATPSVTQTAELNLISLREAQRNSPIPEIRATNPMLSDFHSQDSSASQQGSPSPAPRAAHGTGTQARSRFLLSLSRDSFGFGGDPAVVSSPISTSAENSPFSPPAFRGNYGYFARADSGGDENPTLHRLNSSHSLPRSNPHFQ